MSCGASIERRAARRLETGSFGSWPARGLACVWECVSNPVRRVRLPAGVRVVGVGGATLGGAGKTPLVLELARSVARASPDQAETAERKGRAAVAVVASGYRTRVATARQVRPDDAVGLVGDEALMLARGLEREGVPTVVGPRRAEAIQLAASLGKIVLVDGLLQTRPARLGCSLLVLNASAPWGAGRCPPAGDLRARPQRLLSAADSVVVCLDPAGQPPSQPPVSRFAGPVFHAPSDIAGALTPDGRLVPNESLRGLRLGLVLAIARPERVRASLASRGIVPAMLEFFSDHAAPIEASGGAPRAGARSRRLDAWLTSGKCATKLGESFQGVPVWVLQHTLSLPPALVQMCATN